MANQIQEMKYEGYLVGDPEMRFLASGTPVTNFRMGSNSQYKDKEGNVVKSVTWIKVAAFGGLAEIVNNLCQKSSWVIVSGKLRPGENGSPAVFQMKNGEWGASFEMTASDVRVLKGKDFDDAQNSSTYDDGGDLPF